MISIIIPTYNEEKAIRKTLDGLKSNLTIPHEIIVTDDKSTDDTVKIAKEYADIVLIPPAKHISIAANRNDGQRHSKGEMLVFMDSDSTIADPDDFFRHALARFESDQRLVALTGKIGVWPELETFGDKAVYAAFNLVHRIKNNLLHIGEASGKFQMIRRDAFEKVGGFNENLICREDGDMFQRLSKVGRTAYDPTLVILHTGRRGHKVGWPKLLSIWMFETFYVALTGRSKSKEWKAIR
ncbi:MAG: glycosyltransferase [Patescibacteria group bacterium]|jgi:glycosyltransferase involved in cell wall biosynthesis